MRRRVIAAAAALALLWPAQLQAGRIDSYVSGYSDGQPIAGLRYVLLPEENQRQGSSFEFPEYARHVERALATTKLVRVADAGSADLIIYVGYGISDPVKHAETTPDAKFIPVSNGSMTTKMTPDGKLVSVPDTTYRWVGTGSSSTTEWTTFDRWLRLSAIDAAEQRQSGKGREHWRLEVKSEGVSNDLRYVMPFMAYSASKYVGVDTGHALRVKVKEKDKNYLQYNAALLAGPAQ
jgi:hypothetical protein